jgi:hypothetical protein
MKIKLKQHVINSESNAVILGANSTGLGGKLKTIAWGLALSEVSNSDYVFIWKLNNECGGKDMIPDRLIKNVNFFVPDVFDKTVVDEFKKETPDCKIAFDFVTGVHRDHPNRDIKKFAREYKVKIRCGIGKAVYCVYGQKNRWKKRFMESLRKIQPTDEVLSKNNAFKEYNVEDMVGVHVRSGDVLQLKKNNLVYGRRYNRKYVGPKKFFKFIDENCDKQCKLFLCTEEKFIIKKFQKRYGDRVIFRSMSDYQRISLNDIQTAYADMIMLSKCKYIIGSKSQFSDISAWIGGRKKHLIS